MLSAAWLVGVLLAVSVGLCRAAGDGSGTSVILRRGPYAILESENPADVEWAGRFEQVEAGGVLDPVGDDVMTTLREAGVSTVLAYDWMPAGYHYPGGDDDPLMQWLFSHRAWAALNPNGPFPHCSEEGYFWCEDYYFDLGAHEVLRRKVDFLVGFAEEYGYDGFFFDWADGGFLWGPSYETMLRTWIRRHPDVDYREAVGELYRMLHEAGLLIHTNQAYREAQYGLLMNVDWDMSESQVTGWSFQGHELDIEGIGRVEVPETQYYPVSDDPSHGDLRETIASMEEMAEIRRIFGGPGLRATVFMSYAAPDFVPAGDDDAGLYKPVSPRNAIFFSFAVPKLLDQIGFTQVTLETGGGELPLQVRSSLSQDPVYFLDLGQPLGTGCEEQEGVDGPFWFRCFEGGLVIVGRWRTATNIDLRSEWIPSGVPLLDAFENQWLVTGDAGVVVPVNPVPVSLFDSSPAPAGRVFLYGVRNLRIEPVDSVTAGEPVTIRASYTGGGNVNLVWDLGDGGVGEGDAVTHVYDQSGHYEVVAAVKGSHPDLAAHLMVNVSQPSPRRAEGRSRSGEQ